MKKRRINETLEVISIVSTEPNVSLAVDNMCSEWGVVTYPQLSVLLVHLRFLGQVHQVHHWTAKGDTFYGDHLLFERLYNGTNEDVDAVAEKAIGLGSGTNVDLALQLAQISRLAQGYGMTQTIPQPTELAKRSLVAEMHFMSVVEALVDSLKSCNQLTRGLDNLIAGIQDKHEGHIYLLQQRVKSGL